MNLLSRMILFIFLLFYDTIELLFIRDSGNSMTKIKIILLILVVLFLNSCRPRTERGLIGGSQTCLMSNNSGTCNGFFLQVNGENQKSFEKIFVLEDNAIYLNFNC